MSKSSVPMHEAHYCSLESQTSVHGLAKFCLPPCGTHKLLIASVEGCVMLLEFQKTMPCAKALQFTYIPGDATIIAIDAYNKSSHGNGVVIGVTFSKTNAYSSDVKVCFYLNIYSEWEFGAEFDLSRIVQGCQNIELSFVPYQLCHTELVQSGNSEVVFLVSGGDQRVHLFREDRILHTFQEATTEEFFPEFADLPSNVTWLDIQHVMNHTQRITAIGCQNGIICITVVNTATKVVQHRWQVQHDSPITSVKLFTLLTEIDCPSFVSQVLETEDDGIEAEGEIHLLVSSATEPTVVYRNVTDRGFGDPLLLPESDRYDCALCGLVADVDFDGQNEVLIGTYGQELLVYKFQPKSGSTKSTSEDDSASLSKSGSLSDGEFSLLWQRSFTDPLLGLDEVDISGDGVNEIIVMTLKGLHVLQHDMNAVQDLCLQRMKAAREQFSKQEDVFTQLLAENLTSDQGVDPT